MVPPQAAHQLCTILWQQEEQLASSLAAMQGLQQELRWVTAANVASWTGLHLIMASLVLAASLTGDGCSLFAQLTAPSILLHSLHRQCAFALIKMGLLARDTSAQAEYSCRPLLQLHMFLCYDVCNGLAL